MEMNIFSDDKLLYEDWKAKNYLKYDTTSCKAIYSIMSDKFNNSFLLNHMKELDGYDDTSRILESNLFYPACTILENYKDILNEGVLLDKLESLTVEQISIWSYLSKFKEPLDKIEIYFDMFNKEEAIEAYNASLTRDEVLIVKDSRKFFKIKSNKGKAIDIIESYGIDLFNKIPEEIFDYLMILELILDKEFYRQEHILDLLNDTNIAKDMRTLRLLEMCTEKELETVISHGSFPMNLPLFLIKELIYSSKYNKNIKTVSHLRGIEKNINTYWLEMKSTKNDPILLPLYDYFYNREYFSKIMNQSLSNMYIFMTKVTSDRIIFYHTYTEDIGKTYIDYQNSDKNYFDLNVPYYLELVANCNNWSLASVIGEQFAFSCTYTPEVLYDMVYPMYCSWYVGCVNWDSAIKSNNEIIIRTMFRFFKYADNFSSAIVRLLFYLKSRDSSYCEQLFSKSLKDYVIVDGTKYDLVHVLSKGRSYVDTFWNDSLYYTCYVNENNELVLKGE